MVSSDCYRTQLKRSKYISTTLAEALTGYYTTHELPKTSAQVAALVKKAKSANDKAALVEVILLSALYGGVPATEGLAALNSEFKDLTMFPSDPTQFTNSVGVALDLAQSI